MTSSFNSTQIANGALRLQTIEKIVSLHASGSSLREIIKHMGFEVFPSTISRWLRKYSGIKSDSITVDKFIDQRAFNRRGGHSIPSIITSDICVLVIEFHYSIFPNIKITAGAFRNYLAASNSQSELKKLFKEKEIAFNFSNIPSIRAIRSALRRYKAYLIRDPDLRYQASFVGCGLTYKVNELWQMDSLMLRFGDKFDTRFDVWVTSMIDVSSRMILASIIHVDTPSTRTAMTCLKKALLSNDSIYVPKVLQTDNDSGFRSHAMIAAVTQLGSESIFISPGMSSTNGVIERSNRTLKCDFVYLRTLCDDGSVSVRYKNGSDRCKTKKEDVERFNHDFVTLLKQSLDQALQGENHYLKIIQERYEEVVRNYNSRHHRSLPKGFTPETYYLANLESGHQPNLGLTAKTVHDTLVTKETRKNLRDAVHVENHKYWCEGICAGETLVVHVPCDSIDRVEPWEYIKAYRDKTEFSLESISLPNMRDRMATQRIRNSVMAGRTHVSTAKKGPQTLAKTKKEKIKGKTPNQMPPEKQDTVIPGDLFKATRAQEHQTAYAPKFEEE